MIRQPSLVALARGLNLAFFLATSIYSLLTYNPFTYEQFITPHVSAVLTNFAVWHPDIHLFVLSVTALTVAPYLERSPARWLGWTYLAGSVVLAVWFFMNPVWLLTARSGAVLPLAIISAFPPVWLAFFDHVAAGARPIGETNDRRIWVSCFAAALFVWMTFAAAAPLRLRLTGGIDVSRQAVLLATGTSAVSHFVVFTIAGLMLTTMTGISALTRSPGKTLYWGLAILSAAAMTVVLLRVVLAPISITGPVAWLVSVAIGVSFAAAWSGIAHLRAAGLESMPALDAWLLPIGPRGSKASWAIGLLLVPIVVQLLVARIATFDWEFMLQKLVAAGAWLIVFACTYRLSRERVAGRLNVLAPLTVVALFAAEQMAMPRVAAWTGDVRLNPEFALDGYAPLDPSFRLTRQVLGSSVGQDTAAFNAYLRANSTIQDAGLKPVVVDFGASASRASSGHPPHIFLFIVDSLRPDYLRPYNGNVSFTPSIAAFGEDSFVFARTFSRYGGTGLAVPSIWAGAMLIHKQYVTPFATTNALEKLVDAHGYRRFISEDHISDALFPANELTVGLDHNGQEMLHTMCGTTAELAERLRGRPNDGRPIFAMTRPLELHIGNIASATTPAGESYPEFYGPYAARVKRIDSCFGTFIDQLKELHLYDNSIVVLTADHGDSLGEGQRWGHGFTVFPEVLRIPLIVHLPPGLRSSVTADLTRVSFATDITPTLYALVNGQEGQEGREGQEGSAGGPREESESSSAAARASGGGAPRAMEKEGSAGGRAGASREALLGEPLFVRPSVDLSARRRGAYLVASSYGAVYGLLSSNGRRLYIADAIEGREYLFDLVPGGRDARAGVTDAERARARHSIQEQIAALAAWYQFAPGR